jgi:hypothetical protein
MARRNSQKISHAQVWSLRLFSGSQISEEAFLLYDTLLSFEGCRTPLPQSRAFLNPLFGLQMKLFHLSFWTFYCFRGTGKIPCFSLSGGGAIWTG